MKDSITTTTNNTIKTTPKKVSTSQSVGLWCPRCGFTSTMKISVATEITTDASEDIDIPKVEICHQTAMDAVCPRCFRSIMIPIDREIFYEVKRLNDLGYATYASCQGHRRKSITADPESNGEYVYDLKTVIDFPGVGFQTGSCDKNLRLIEAWRRLHGQTEWRNIDMAVVIDYSDETVQLDYNGFQKFRQEAGDVEFHDILEKARVNFELITYVSGDTRKYKPERSTKTFKVFLQKLYFELKDD